MRKGVSHLYALVKTVEFDVVLGDDSFALRVELFQGKTRRQTFRANIWRNELYRIQSTFPQNPSTGRPEHQPSDEVVLIDWSSNLRANYSAFKAASSPAALNMLLNAIPPPLHHSPRGNLPLRP